MADLNVIKPQQVQTMINKFCCTIGMLPTSYKTSLTYEEQILAIGHYLETVVYPAINQNAEALEELQGLFIALHDYVNNYFDNLDVQEEINNKIDEMAESGDLQEIITQYLQVAGVLCYNTINDLKNATNLQEGSFARTFGKTTYNDGKGALYKIRTITSGDVVDEDNIISVNFSNTLIGEKQQNLRIDTIEANINNIEEQIDRIGTPTNFYDVPTIVIGDSYLYGYVDSQTRITGFGTYLKNALQVSNANWEEYPALGGGFNAGDNAFIGKLQSITQNRNKYKRIIVAGGFNDRGYNRADTITDIHNFIDYANTNFPNAEILIAFIGWSSLTDNNGTTYRSNCQTCLGTYQQGSLYGKNVRYLSGSENILHNYTYFNPDGFHPNQDGQVALGNALAQCVQGTKYVKNEPSHAFTLSSLGTEEYIANNMLYFTFEGTIQYASTGQSVPRDWAVGTISNSNYFRQTGRQPTFYVGIKYTLADDSVLYENIRARIINNQLHFYTSRDSTVQTMKSCQIYTTTLMLPIEDC